MLVSDTYSKLLFNTDTPISYSTWGKANVSLNGNLSIQSNNNFSDGTTGFNTGLFIQGGTTTNPIGFAFQLSTGDSTTSTNPVVMGTTSSSDLRFMVGNSSGLILTSTKRAGIQTMTPSYNLHVSGTGVSNTLDAAGSGIAYFLKRGGLVSTIGPVSSVAVAIGCAGAILASAGVYTTSDARIKKDWTDISDDVVNAMLSVKPCMFRYKSQDDNVPLQIGYSAQDLLRAGLPHVVNFNENEAIQVEDPEVDTEGIQYSVDYPKVAVLLHKVVLAQEERIRNLEEKLSTLL